MHELGSQRACSLPAGTQQGRSSGVSTAKVLEGSRATQLNWSQKPRATAGAWPPQLGDISPT